MAMRSLWIPLVCVLAPGLAGSTPPLDLTYQGQYLEGAAPGSEAPAIVELRVLSSDHTPLYREEHEHVHMDAGLFALRLGAGRPVAGELEETVGSAGHLIEVRVDGRPLGPPEPVRPHPERPLAIDPPSPELRVFDVDGRQLGLYAGERLQGGDQLYVHRPDVGLTLAFRARTGELGVAGLELFYDEPDCLGRAFVTRRLRGVVFGQDEWGYQVGTATQALRPLVAQSRRIDGEGCRNEEELLTDVVPVTSIPSIPLEARLPPPLHVGVIGE